MSILTGALSPRARSVLYLTFAAVSLAVSATATGFAAADTAVPVWLTVTTSVVGYVGTALGLTASANTPAPEAGPPGGYPVDGTDYGETHRDA